MENSTCMLECLNAFLLIACIWFEMTFCGNFQGFVKIGGICPYYLPIPIIWDQVSISIIYHFVNVCLKFPLFGGKTKINLTKEYLQEEDSKPSKEKEEDNKHFWVLSDYISNSLFTTDVNRWSISRKLT